jgi:hypothetical protein
VSAASTFERDKHRWIDYSSRPELKRAQPVDERLAN